MVRFNDIVEEILKYNPQADVDMLERAYVLSAKAHKGTVRLSGEPYLIHPLEVAYILTRMNLDTLSVASGLLHDTLEDSYLTKEELEEYFGEEVAGLVDGVTKISRIKMSGSEDTRAESLRKMILAMSKDIRVILIKLADRFHNMQTLRFLSAEKQEEISRETLEIYAPLAHRLGIEWMKGELEDLAFKYLKPDDYRLIGEKIAAKKRERDAYIEEVKELLKKRFEQVGLACQVSGRAKRLYSIYRKMVQDGLDIDQLYDITAFRVTVDTVRECYEALGYIHGHDFFKPIPGRFKDYIALPKANMYQSLHTAVIGPYGEKIEIQIRTHEMHKVAEEGIAAHWKYKEGKVFDPKEDRMFAPLRQIIEQHEEVKDDKEFLESVKIDLFPDEIYVFTPKGDVKELPKGATAVDFAYSIHSALGHRCIGAKVNGRLVPLRTPLKSGDTIDILTNPAHKPSKDWLKFVVTSKAKTKIRQWVKEEQREQSIEMGRTLLEKELTKHDFSLPAMLKAGDILNLAQDFSFDTVDDLFAAIGYGLYTPLQVLGKVIPETPKVGRLQKMISSITKSRDDAIKIKGIDGLFVKFAKCCNPIPGDRIVGFITRGRGLTVHLEECPNVHTYDEQRKVAVSWQTEKDYTYSARLRVSADDKKGLLSDISSSISSSKANIVSAQVTTSPDRTATSIFEIEIQNASQLQKIVKSILKLKGVKAVERLRSTGG
jgi:GTP pyrophosphokinase